MNDKVILKLDTMQQIQLFHALNAMDGQDKLCKVNGQETSVRVPYVLGVKIRRAIVRNLAAIKASLLLIDETKQANLTELWPEAPQMKDGPIEEDKFPSGVFEKFKSIDAEASKQKEELTLYTIPGDILEASENDLPLFVLSALDEHGLITDNE